MFAQGAQFQLPNLEKEDGEYDVGQAPTVLADQPSSSAAADAAAAEAAQAAEAEAELARSGLGMMVEDGSGPSIQQEQQQAEESHHDYHQDATAVNIGGASEMDATNNSALSEDPSLCSS